ncbi:MAG: methyltransferase domain-containing protein [Candidatus Omnitrophica bacterium]|nr:methyltransferase domain-containing protein [Candidatus Omnitrophota bacterium]MDD5237578.1 methyltransferase domain-containing protein [Candidatus Omnitrophota bacterium]
MNNIFWGGKLTIPIKILINTNFFISWLLGKNKNIPAMKHRIRLGYSGTYTNHVNLYDKTGGKHYSHIAEILLNDIEIKGKTILDVGCGTGIVSFLALEKGASNILGIDLSRKMIKSCEKKVIDNNLDSTIIQFKQTDAESPIIKGSSFQVVLSSLMLGFIPNQLKVIQEIKRVLEPGGLVGISTHGPEHYWEACDATFRIIDKKIAIGYRVEFWPRNEIEIKSLFKKCDFKNIKVYRLKWKEQFDSPEKAYDFFAATSSSWWFSKFPTYNRRMKESRRIRAYFKLKGIKRISMDVILAYGEKPIDKKVNYA